MATARSWRRSSCVHSRHATVDVMRSDIPDEWSRPSPKCVVYSSLVPSRLGLPIGGHVPEATRGADRDRRARAVPGVRAWSRRPHPPGVGPERRPRAAGEALLEDRSPAGQQGPARAPCTARIGSLGPAAQASGVADGPVSHAFRPSCSEIAAVRLFRRLRVCRADVAPARGTSRGGLCCGMDMVPALCFGSAAARVADRRPFWPALRLRAGRTAAWRGAAG